MINVYDYSHIPRNVVTASLCFRVLFFWDALYRRMGPVHFFFGGDTQSFLTHFARIVVNPCPNPRRQWKPRSGGGGGGGGGGQLHYLLAHCAWISCIHAWTPSSPEKLPQRGGGGGQQLLHSLFSYPRARKILTFNSSIGVGLHEILQGLTLPTKYFDKQKKKRGGGGGEGSCLKLCPNSTRILPQFARIVPKFRPNFLKWLHYTMIQSKCQYVHWVLY